MASDAHPPHEAPTHSLAEAPAGARFCKAQTLRARDTASQIVATRAVNTTLATAMYNVDIASTS